MTEQYAQININNPRITRFFAGTSPVFPPPNIVLVTFDDELIICDTSGGLLGFQLPLASQFPGWEVFFKATNAGTSGNAVFIRPDPASGETIDGALIYSLTEDQQALYLKSDGQNWRVISDSSGSGSSISLDLTFDPTAAAAVPPILFTDWVPLIAAIAQIPGNPLASPPYVTSYRLNVESVAGGVIPPGTYSLLNAIFRSAVKEAPLGLGLGIPASGAVLFEDIATIEGVAAGGLTFGPTFTWSELDFVDIKDSTFGQTLDGFGPGVILIDNGAVLIRTSGNTQFTAGAVEVSGGSTLVMDAYDRTVIESGAVFGAGLLVINVLSPDTDISVVQGAGAFDLNIGGGSGFIPPPEAEYSLGETIFFSSGGPISFATTTEAELYPGGTNPTGATAPQIPPGSAPIRSYTAPKNGYLKGIGITIPTPEIIGLDFEIRVYVGGVLTTQETFNTLDVHQFSDFTFGQYFEGDDIAVTIIPIDTDADTSLTNGILVALRSS